MTLDEMLARTAQESEALLSMRPQTEEERLSHYMRTANLAETRRHLSTLLLAQALRVGLHQ